MADRPDRGRTATRLRPASLILAWLSAAGVAVDAFNAAVGASAAARVTTEMVFAALSLAVIGGVLVQLGRIRARAADRDDADSRSASTGLGAITLVLWLAVAVALVALARGNIGLGLFIATLIAWATVLGSALYLLVTGTDDVVTTAFNRDSHVGMALTRAIGVRGSVIDQFGLLLSAALRIMLVIVAIGLLLSPFGGGGGLGAIFGRLGVLAQGIEIGGVAVSPGAILRGAIVLGVGLALLRGFMRWLETRYLPATDLDTSGRNSVSLVLRYLGIALATVWALASLGIGVERIALLLSALSVGIGFGLQAITQNFISGLILLAERPIKIGDLVRVGTDEGDVRRISVRSTEIELADHSTLIVPNSELITKSVLNKTLAGPLGRVQIRFSVPIEADAGRVRAIVLDAFAGADAVLDEPPPAAFIDSLVDDRIQFNCIGHVAGPREVYRTRSDVLAVLLRRFREEDIPLGTVPQALQLIAPAAD